MNQNLTHCDFFDSTIVRLELFWLKIWRVVNLILEIWFLNCFSRSGVKMTTFKEECNDSLFFSVDRWSLFDCGCRCGYGPDSGCDGYLICTTIWHSQVSPAFKKNLAFNDFISKKYWTSSLLIITIWKTNYTRDQFQHETIFLTCVTPPAKTDVLQRAE